MTTLASDTEDETASAPGTFPAVLLAIWHFATVGRPASLIPPPYDVWLELRDLAFGGINDDAYSGTLYVHLLASVGRVYGGFALPRHPEQKRGNAPAPAGHDGVERKIIACGKE